MNLLNCIIIFIFITNINCNNNLLSEYNKTNQKFFVTETGEYIKVNKLFKFLYSPNSTYADIIKHETEKFHWLPYKRVQYFLGGIDEPCEDRQSGEDIPESIFSSEQLKNGAIIVYFIGAIYFFTLLTVVCNDYFLPSVECICDDLNISKDVAAATFMATATSTPEFFTNTISTFITKSDLGLGTIIGSLMFNTLGVAALAGLIAKRPVQLDWWPISRDCILYSINLSVLIAFSWDGVIYWYEAMIFVILYFIYFLIMFQNNRIMNFTKKYFEIKWRFFKNRLNENDKIQEPETPSKDQPVFVVPSTNPQLKQQTIYNRESSELSVNSNGKPTIQEVATSQKSLWHLPREKTKFKKFWWLYTWPIKFLLTCTIPNPKTWRKLYPLAFIMCIIWIGINSYMVVWMIIQIGETFRIPDSVMGLTFLAAGGCLPEAISAVIMARKGEGGMGVSNSLGANSLAILFSLGLPWFIRTMVDGGKSSNAFVNIHSYGIEYVILSLLLTVVGLYGVIMFAGYRLKKIVGGILLLIYTIFVTLAILVELDVFFPSGNKC